MSHLVKTSIFAAFALVVGLLAVFVRPSLKTVSPEEELGKKLFPGLKDPLAVAGLEIVEADKAGEELISFKVAQVDGVWSIPSHKSYPADAKDQMVNAVSSVMDLEILSVVSDSSEEHKMYWVVEPNEESLKEKKSGMGMLVVLQDAKKNDLAKMIIGKEVPDKKELRYVRRANQDRVYTIKVDISKLSTKLEDWIEKDLLQLEPHNIKQLVLNDYAFAEIQEPRGTVTVYQPGGTMTLAQASGEWKLLDWKKQGKDGQVKGEMGKDEELNAAKLDELKKALDDLKFVDVARKPREMADQLLSEKGVEKLEEVESPFHLHPEIRKSLGDKGFRFGRGKDGKTFQILSDAGEILVQMQDGVEYVLRFGKDTGKENKSGGGKKADTGLNRYILVSARVSKDTLEKPAAKPLPELPSSKPPEKKENPPGDKKEPPKDDKAKKEEEEKKKKEAEDKKKKEEEDRKRIEEDRKRIEEENKRALQDHDKKVKEVGEKVRKLNARFADWYFVVSEDFYKKIRLAPEDVIKKKDKPKEEPKPKEPPK